MAFVFSPASSARATLSDMLRAFRLNLQALSLLALFVGVFLVYNTAMFAVVSRRRDAGILRSLGASRREIIFAFLVGNPSPGGSGRGPGRDCRIFPEPLSDRPGCRDHQQSLFLPPARRSRMVLVDSACSACSAGVRRQSSGGIFSPGRTGPGRPGPGPPGAHRSPGAEETAGKAALAGLGILGVSLALWRLPPSMSISGSPALSPCSSAPASSRA